ncbi:NAD(P)-dependent oxidoreductase [Roseomonas sp. BN140053]|uniref:NAD(P)-dependent oxidoreductase n=1 Tax=Roseomonas sp. BN140053 TaxID=3391898 RepID=UPI0039EB21AC
MGADLLLAGTAALICRDTTHADLLDELATTLEARGVEIFRVPAAPPGEKLLLDPAWIGQQLARSDLIVPTIRHLCTRETLLAAPRLKGICFPTIGVESLDLTAATELGLPVGHGATEENWTGMAEATILLILALLYDLAGVTRVLRDRLPRPQPLLGRQLAGKTVGLIGYGRIARAVAARLTAFDVELLAHSPSREPGSVSEGVSFTSLEDLLRRSDVVVVLVSINPASRGLLNGARLGLMKPSAVLVNTARGEAIEEAALVQVLRERRIAGAALDSFEVEPPPADSPLRALDNVILTPHLIGHTRESAESFRPALLENAVRILRGEAPLICRNPEVMVR